MVEAREWIFVSLPRPAGHKYISPTNHAPVTTIDPPTNQVGHGAHLPGEIHIL